MDADTIGIIWVLFLCLVFGLNGIKYELLDIWKWIVDKCMYVYDYLYDKGADLEGIKPVEEIPDYRDDRNNDKWRS